MDINELLFKTEPYSHQREALRRSLGAPVFGLFMEQRTGKSKVVIDTAAHHYFMNGLAGLLIVAMPGRVHRNWAINEIPAHLSSLVPRLSVVWESSKVPTKAFQAQLEALLTFEGLSILCVNGEAIITEAFRKYAPRFLKARKKVMVAADEFTLIMKTAGIGRTRVMHAIGRRPEVVLKRILDGTPVGESPLDLYAPMMFLDWRIFGFTSYFSFKHHFARWVKKTNWGTGRDYETLDRGEDGTSDPYQNLDELQKKLDPVSYRVLFRDCFDVPPKVYQPYTYQLSKEQRRVYGSLRSEYEAELASSTVSARHVLTRYLRLQQICSNYWPPEKQAMVHDLCKGEGCEGCDDLGVVIGKTPLRIVDPHNHPRLDLCTQILERNSSAGIVWCRFHQDVDQVLVAAKEMGRVAVRYDGLCTPEEKDQSEEDFQTGKADLLVGNPASGGRGLRLDKGQFILNYSHYFSLLIRLQGEDRCEAANKTTSTGIIDISAEDTIDDEVILPALRSKRSVVDFVLRERSGKWL